MDEESKSKVKTEVKDGYSQLAEKMEQVRSQMVKMERKYDELYQTVKEKEHSRNPSVDQTSPEASKSPTESVEQPSAEESVKAQEAPAEEGAKPNEMDIEKMEDNPFL